MLDVCAEMDKSHKIGDIIISKEIVNYEQVKLNDDRIISRRYHYYPGDIYKLFDATTCIN